MDNVKTDLFEQLYSRYYTMSYRFILSKVQDPWLAEDLLSEVFMKVYKHREEIKDATKSGSWIFKIASNTVIDFYRKKNNVELKDEIAGEAVYEKGYDEIFIRDEFKNVTENLPVDMKEILAMRFFQGLKFKEIGMIMDLTESRAKRRVYKALKTAREMYEVYNYSLLQ